MTAIEAKQLTSEANQKRVEPELQKVLAKIEISAKKGKSMLFLRIHNDLYLPIIEELNTNLKYTVYDISHSDNLWWIPFFWNKTKIKIFW